MPAEFYRNMILERIKRFTGAKEEAIMQNSAEAARIDNLTEILHQASVLEEMIKVERRSSTKVSFRISSKFSSSKKQELTDTLQSLDSLKQNIWSKCESIGSSIKAGDSAAQFSSGKKSEAGTNLIHCHSCGGNLTILAYDNFRCQNCGIGYSARDYLENLNASLSEI